MLPFLQLRTVSENYMAYASSIPSSTSIADAVNASGDTTLTTELDTVLVNHRRMMFDAKASNLVLYMAAEQLLHGVHIGAVYEGIDASDCIQCPEIIARWNHLTKQERTCGTLLEHLYELRDTIQLLRADVCYPYLKNRIEEDIRLVREEIASELCMSYHVLGESELMNILTLLEVPEGLKSILQDCAWSTMKKVDVHQTNTSAEFLYLSVGLVLLILIGVVCFYRFKRGS